MRKNTMKRPRPAGSPWLAKGILPVGLLCIVYITVDYGVL